MRKIIFSLSFLAASLLSFTVAEKPAAVKKEKHLKVHDETHTGIKFFQGSWEEALKKAEQEDKLIFLDAYAAWCGPCKRMEQNTFSHPKVGNYFNEKFINFKMDMERDPNGVRLSRKFSLTSYPSLYFVDKTEELIHYDKGYKDFIDLLAAGKMAVRKF